jgi:hypothetical protein
MENSLLFSGNWFQLARMHRGIRKVVSNIKNKDKPSIPNIKLIFKNDNHCKYKIF